MKLSKSVEVIMVPEDDYVPKKATGHHEEGVEVPFELINPDTLRNLISEFVTREWEELGDASYTLDNKIDQVLLQLKERKIRLVFDGLSGSCNLTPVKGT